jgi:GTP-binding protein
MDTLAARLGLLAEESARTQPEREPVVVLRPGRPRFTVERGDDAVWRIRGRNVERWVMETDLDDERQVEKLQTRLRKEGVERRLAALGARRGDDVEIRGRVFEYVPDEEAVGG